MSRAYYNEIDPFAAAWLRELMKAGEIPDGEVDTRSIADVEPGDLRGFTACHFFAGIGGWAYALALAGWPADRAVWTGSCPCQPWSVAGARLGAADARHVWPTWHRLIEECRPDVVFGEQVDSPDGLEWIDLVRADLERSDYAFAPVGVCAAGCGAPELRHRLWFVADTASSGPRKVIAPVQVGARRATEPRREGSRMAGHLGHATGERPAGQAGTSESFGESVEANGRDIVGLADAYRANGEYWQLQQGWRLVQLASDPLAGFWSGADWLRCDDGKIRPVESGTFPLAHGLPARVGRLRGYGNAIVPQVAAEVIAAYLEISA